MRRALLLAFLPLAVADCRFRPNPDRDRFNCASDADCGPDHLCVVQVITGKGICFAAGQCGPETCNGKDDDCDGVVDDHVPGTDTPCDTTGKDVCSAGVVACVAGQVTCVGQVLKRPEACDGISDLDCDGLVGCADPDCDGRPACGPGCICRGTAEVETDCADGVDNDNDGLVDCDDPDCLGQGCGASGAGNCGTAGPAFDPDAGAADGGSADDGGTSDAGSADAGPARAYCALREANCADGLDNDGDGKADCLDGDCLGQPCNADGGTCLPDGGCQ